MTHLLPVAHDELIICEFGDRPCWRYESFRGLKHIFNHNLEIAQEIAQVRVMKTNRMNWGRACDCMHVVSKELANILSVLVSSFAHGLELQSYLRWYDCFERAWGHLQGIPPLKVARWLSSLSTTSNLKHVHYHFKALRFLLALWTHHKTFMKPSSN